MDCSIFSWNFWDVCCTNPAYSDMAMTRSLVDCIKMTRPFSRRWNRQTFLDENVWHCNWNLHAIYRMNQAVCRLSCHAFPHWHICQISIPSPHCQGTQSLGSTPFSPTRNTSGRFCTTPPRWDHRTLGPPLPGINSPGCRGTISKLLYIQYNTIYSYSKPFFQKQI